MSKKNCVCAGRHSGPCKPSAVQSPSDVIYLHLSWSIQDLEGKILTFIDASIADPVQRKALKDLLRPMIWQWAIVTDRKEYYEIKDKPVGNSNL